MTHAVSRGSRVLRLPSALSSREKEEVQQNRYRQREPGQDVPPAVPDEGRDKADDAQRADDYRRRKDLSKRSMTLRRDHQEDIRGVLTAEPRAMARSTLTPALRLRSQR